MNCHSVITRHEAAIDSPVHDEVIVTQTVSGSYFSLDGTAREIWDLIAGPATVESICEHLSKAHAVDLQVIEPDIFEFLATLERAGLIRIDG